jgi:alpha-glucosidase
LLLPWDASAIRESIVEYYAALRGGMLPSFVFGNHDQSRLATRFGEANHRSVNTLLLTLWGVPTMYYGDELGMVDGLVLPHQKQDPFSFEYSEFGLGRDPARTPMQWDDSANAGFTTAAAQTWLPIKTHFHSHVAEQENDPTSTLNYCRRLLQLRHEYPALNRGSIQFIDAGSELLVYERKADGQRILVVINFGAAAQSIDLTALYTNAELLASSMMDNPTIADLGDIAIRPHESLVLNLR